LEPSGDCHRTASERFVLYSDPWVNLHHFLYQWARNVPPRKPGDPEALEIPESQQIGELDERERAAWDRALLFYREQLASRDLIHDSGLIALRNPLAAIACSGGTPDAIAAGLRAVLLDAMPVYRRHWWPGHLAQDQDWIERLLPALKPNEAVLAGRLADAYGGRWSDERIRVDVAVYASWQGAYTTNDPNQITVASDPRVWGVQGVDLVFHEVSHASFFEQPLLGQLSAAFRAHGAHPPPGLAHAIQFVTASELVRRQLHGEDLRKFKPLAEMAGLFRNPQWARFKRVLEAHWVPFLAGKLGRAEALDQVAADLTKPDKASETRHAYHLPAGNRVRALWIDPGDVDDRLSARLARP
jgi:hypothetical protein